MIQTVKSVNLCYLSTLVVSSEEGDFIWVSWTGIREAELRRESPYLALKANKRDTVSRL